MRSQILGDSKDVTLMTEPNPFDEIDEPESKKKKDKRENEKDALKEERKRAKLTLDLETEDLEFEKKPAKLIVLVISFLLFVSALLFNSKPVAISQNGESEYAITVRLILAGPEFVKGECRPIGPNSDLANTVVTLRSTAAGSTYKREAKLPFTDVTYTEDRTSCYFKILFSGVSPADGKTFEVSAQILDTYLNKSYQVDTALQLPRIMFEVN